MKKIESESVLFVLYAFFIPIVCVGLMKIIDYCVISEIISFILYGIEGASPTIAAVIIVMQKRGINGLRRFLIDKYKNGFNIKLCVLGLILPCFVITVGKVLTYLTPYHNQLITSVSINKLIVIAWALIAEELGWRGYLQEKLEYQIDEGIIPLIIGIIWAYWHYHFFISGSMEVPIILFIFGCIVESYGYYVITKMAKGNVIPASLWHFSGNLFFNLYRINPNWNNGRIEPYVIVSSAYVVFLLWGIWYIIRNKRTIV